MSLLAERAPPRSCLLGVERSLTGRRWELRAADERAGLALAQRLGLPEPVARALAARGVDEAAAEAFLEPSLREQLPDPDRLAGMAEAAARLAEAVRRGERVAVFGDYDVDGATSAALLQRFFRAVGLELLVYVPDRLKEGYGPNEAALLELRRQGVELLVTVDCGITAYEPLQAAREAGLEVIVVDHHAAEPRLPAATAVVNPNRLDDASGLGGLAAVGVAFLLVVAVNRALREAGWYVAGRPEPKLLQWLDLVALGTVCDVVPLTGLNRALVVQGLKVMARRANPGLRALGEVAALDERPGAYHLGFLLGPRVNAGGRVGEAGLGARLLATEDAAEAAAIAARLDAWNRERRVIEAQVLDQALGQLAAGPEPEGLVFVAGQGWHPGVIGIVASRLKERFSLPALVLALQDDGLAKGSGRSVPGLDLGAAVLAARQAGLLVNGGGHPMAAGLTVAAVGVAALRDFLQPRLAAELRRLDWQPALGFDGTLTPRGADGRLLRDLERLAPFGAGNPEPRWVLPHLRLVRADPVGAGAEHLRMVAAGEDGRRLKAIAFRAFESPLGEALQRRGEGRLLHLAGKLRADAWSGPEAVQLVVDDAAFAEA